MRKITITIIFLLCSMAGMAQKKNKDSHGKPRYLFEFTNTKADTGLISLNNPSVASTFASTPSGYLVMRQTPTKWVAFYNPNFKPWHVDNPDSTGGVYVLHINKKQLKFINDSTAIYIPLKLK